MVRFRFDDSMYLRWIGFRDLTFLTYGFGAGFAVKKTGSYPPTTYNSFCASKSCYFIGSLISLGSYFPL